MRRSSILILLAVAVSFSCLLLGKSPDVNASGDDRILPAPIDPPIAIDDFYSIHGISSGTLHYLDNDIPPNWNGTVQVTSGPSHGTMNGASIYNPNSGYVGTDSFAYKVCDNFQTCTNVATVSLDVWNNIHT